MTIFAKAYLLVEGGKHIYCWFNPTSLNVKRNAKWEGGNRLNGKVIPLTYLGGREQSLSLKLLFHAEGLRTAADVQESIDDLYALLAPKDPNAEGLDHNRPPTVEFIWGWYRSDPAVITSVDVTTELFDVDGSPLRAWVSLSMSRSLAGPEAAAKKPTNPTTMATHRRRAHEVAPGEDIALIAHRHYRDATRWSEIATANELDDPLLVQAPELLMVPLERP